MCALQVAANKQSSGYKEDSAAHVDGSPEKALDTQIPIEPGSDPPSDSKETVSTILLAQQAREKADDLSADRKAAHAHTYTIMIVVCALQAPADKQSGKADDLSADRKAAHAHTYAIMILEPLTGRLREPLLISRMPISVP
jgi:hypothetical protein